MHSFDLLNATSLDEACRLLADAGDDGKPIAGGTSLMLFLKEGMYEPRCLIRIDGLSELQGIEPRTDGALRIGALETLSTLERSAALRAHAPMAADAIGEVANIRIRNVATLGGNLCHADPHCDPAPALICLNAQVCVAGLQGERALPLEDFFVDYYQTVLAPGELVKEIVIPPAPPTWRTAYQRFTPLSAEDWPCVGVAVALEQRNGAVSALHVMLSAVNSVPTRVTGIDEIVGGEELSAERMDEVGALAAEQAEPVSDFRGSEWYKRKIVRVLVKRTIAQALNSRT